MPRHRFERERAARKEAESLLMAKSRELFDALQGSRDAERRLQMALWASGEGIWEWRSRDRVLRIDGLFFDAQPAQVPCVEPEGLLDCVHPDDREALELGCRLHFNGSRPDIDAAFRVRHGAQWRWVRARGRVLQRDGEGGPLAVSGTLKDVTVQRESEHALHLLAHAFSSTRDALAVVDARWSVVQANASFCELAAASAPPLGDPIARYVELPAAVGDTGHWRGECTLTRHDGQQLPAEVSVTAVAEQAGQGRCYIVVLRDISERRRAELELERQALHDSLTGLPNRASLDQELARRFADGRPFALLFLDLDGFKGINDGFGHRAGDELLQRVGERLAQALPHAFVARWGGDEFVVIGPPGGDEEPLAGLADRVLESIGRPYTVDGHTMQVTPSIGGVHSPQHGTDGQTLLRRADAAMYAAKQLGRNQMVTFHPALDDGVQRRTRLQGLLRADAERDAFHFVLQPKVDGRGRQVGAEMLMRWSPPSLGPVSPAEFIPLAEQIGVIDRMGRLALRSAARVARMVRARGSAATVAVNLSPRQLLRPDLVSVVMAACEAECAHPSWLELELTESALVSDIGAVTQLLMRLRELGFSLALDDFGTGYSAFSHLRHLPFQKVKIDRSFVMDLHSDLRSRAVLEGIVGLCGCLGLSTVAEGVETQDQFEWLRAMGVQEFQGYLFAPPQSQEAWFDSLQQQGALAAAHGCEPLPPVPVSGRGAASSGR